MIDSSQQWSLFGYDMRDVGKHWLAAWRDLLWGYDSPVRRRLDEVVCLRSNGKDAYFQAGIPSALTSAACSAVLLPEDLVLSKPLALPAAVESDLEAVLSLEVAANSPFAAEDTGYGWHITGRNESQIQLVLVIVSISSVMTYLGREFDSHDLHQQEVWADVSGDMVVVHGFGEDQRQGRYRKRLVRSAVMLGVIALLLLSIAGVSAGLKGMELQQVQDMAASTQQAAADISGMRSSLAVANETITAVNEVLGQFPNPHAEIARLTKLLGDDASVDRFSANGLEIDLRGRAQDAASIMQLLNDQPEYVEVTAPRAISKVQGTEQELFYLSIELREGGGQL